MSTTNTNYTISKVIMFNSAKRIHHNSNIINDTIVESEFLCKGDYDGDGNEEVAIFDVNGSFIIIKDDNIYSSKFIKSTSSTSLNHKHIAAVDSILINQLNSKSYIAILYMNGFFQLLSLNEYKTIENDNDDNNMNSVSRYANIQIVREQSKLIMNSKCMKIIEYKDTILLFIGDRKKLVIYASKISNIFNFTMICEEHIGACVTSIDYMENSDFIVLGLSKGIALVYQIENFSFYVEEQISLSLDSPSQISTRASTPGVSGISGTQSPFNNSRQTTPALSLPFMALYQHITPSLHGNTPYSNTPEISLDSKEVPNKTIANEHEPVIELSSNDNDPSKIIGNSLIHTQPKRVLPVIPSAIGSNDSMSEMIEKNLMMELSSSNNNSITKQQQNNGSYLNLKLISPSLEDILCDSSENPNDGTKYVTLPTYVKTGKAFRRSVIASSNEYVFAVARLDGRISFCQITNNEIECDNEVTSSYSWQTIFSIQTEDSPFQIDFILDDIIDPSNFYDNFSFEATSTYCCGIHSRGGRTILISLEVMADYNIFFQSLGQPVHPITLLFDSELLIGEEPSRNFCYANNALYYVNCSGVHIISRIKEQLGNISSATIKFKESTISTIKFLLESMSTYHISTNDRFENMIEELPNNTRAILNDAFIKFLSIAPNDNVDLAIAYVIDELMKQQ